jgi:hypothetical protein
MATVKIIRQEARPFEKGEHRGALYQLRAKAYLHQGEAVAVNAPYDHYGYIVSIMDTNDRGTLYLIRGTGRDGMGQDKNAFQF